jgi:hypothetical protein
MTHLPTSLFYGQGRTDNADTTTHYSRLLSECAIVTAGERAPAPRAQIEELLLCRNLDFAPRSLLRCLRERTVALPF